jgi:hypothetical protein
MFTLFTGDILGTIKVEKDGVTVDGAGYAIKGVGSGINLKQSDATSRSGCSGVVVKNVRFCDKSLMFVSANGNSFINNTFEGGGLHIQGGVAGDNEAVIKHNVFIDCYPAIFIDWVGVDVASENDFINCRICLCLYGLLDFDRNYWNDYKTLDLLGI